MFTSFDVTSNVTVTFDVRRRKWPRGGELPCPSFAYLSVLGPRRCRTMTCLRSDCRSTRPLLSRRRAMARWRESVGTTRHRCRAPPTSARSISSGTRRLTRSTVSPLLQVIHTHFIWGTLSGFMCIYFTWGTEGKLYTGNQS